MKDLDKIENIPNIGKDTTEKVTRLYLAGLTRSEISREYGIPSAVVQSVITSAGIAPDNTLKAKSVIVKNTIEGKRKIQVNRNTWIYLKPDQDEKEAVEKWLAVINREKSI